MTETMAEKIKAKVMIGYPVGGSCHPAFTKSLLELQRFELLNPAEDYELLPIEYSSDLYVQNNRNILVELAQIRGADWLLQLDTDEGFKHDALRQMMKTADRATRPIVFGLYSNIMRAPAEVEGGYYYVDMIFREVENGEYENIIPASDYRPFLVDAAGSGVLLTHMSIYDRIEYPWYWVDLIQPEGKARPQIMNEDISFCRKAREAGFQLWCDPRVEAEHFKTMALLPSNFRHFMERAKQVEQEMKGF